MSWEVDLDPVDVLMDEFARELTAGTGGTNHENILRWRSIYESKSRETRVAVYGHDILLRWYYGGHGKHPDDERLPINLWDSTP